MFGSDQFFPVKSYKGYTYRQYRSSFEGGGVSNGYKAEIRQPVDYHSRGLFICFTTQTNRTLRGAELDAKCIIDTLIQTSDMPIKVSIMLSKAVDFGILNVDEIAGLEDDYGEMTWFIQDRLNSKMSGRISDSVQPAINTALYDMTK